MIKKRFLKTRYLQLLKEMLFFFKMPKSINILTYESSAINKTPVCKQNI
jgi:hypothetical protein